MSSSPFTSADLAAVRAAMARGERSVEFADRSVTYRSSEELIALEARILADLAETNRRPRQYLGVSGKGLS